MLQGLHMETAKATTGENDMTITQTIITAQEYAKRDAIEAACRLLNKAMVTAKRAKDQMRIEIAKREILDAAVDATVSRSHK